MCEVTFIALSFVVICHAVDEYNKHSRNVTCSIYLLSAVLSLFEVHEPTDLFVGVPQDTLVSKMEHFVLLL